MIQMEVPKGTYLKTTLLLNTFIPEVLIFVSNMTLL